MKYNSFCVKVMYGDILIHHDSPTTLDKAQKKYEEYIDTYFDKLHRDGTQIGALGNLKNDLIERQVRQWMNFPNFLEWIFNIKCESIQKLYKVELLHSRIS